MHWPQITWLLLTAIGLGVALEQQGKPKTGNHSLFGSLVATAIAGWLLWAGGFFSQA